MLLPFRFFFLFFSWKLEQSPVGVMVENCPFSVGELEVCTITNLHWFVHLQQTKTKQKQTWREHRPDRFQFKKIRVFFFYCLLSKNKTKNLHGFGYLEVDYSMLLPKKHQLIGTSLANKHSNSNSSYSKVLMKIYFLHFLFDFTRTSHICSV